ELDAALSASIHKVCQKEGVTLFMFLLSAFKVLLSRYSGQEDICVGTPIANRTQSELEEIIGLFVNTLAIRSEVNNELSFKELLTQVKQTTLEGYDHQLASFEKVVNRIISNRDLSMSPLFQVMFVLQNTPEEVEIELEDLKVTQYEYEGNTSLFDLTLNVDQKESGIVLQMEYCSALFNRVTIQKMLIHYKKLLRSILLSPSSNIGNLSILTDEESHTLLDVFNDTKVEYPEGYTLISLFEDQVSKNPDAIAVVFEDKELTYKELNEKSNRLAHHLQKQYELDSGSFVGIMLERSEWSIISMLGIMKSGAVYVPIDTEYPISRKSFIIEDTQLKVLIIESENLFDSIELNVPVFSIDIELESLSQEDTFFKNPSFKVLPNDLAYVIYTSGSTGVPKGVMIEHQSIINTICSQIDSFSIKANDHCLQFASHSFDASVWEIYISLLGGASLYIVSEGVKSDTTLFSTYIKKNGVTFATLPPAFLQVLNGDDLLGIETLITAGEKIPVEVAQLFSENHKYINAYGPTETSICATTFDGPIVGDNVPIGKPISNTSVYIVDSEINLLPIGVVGELCIGGPGLARGYLNRKELTNEKFVNNPFVDGESLYKTGDLARWLADGNIEFIGRTDDQVKIRGYRIELEEIERAVLSNENIQSCCVLVKDDAMGNRLLVGYLVGKEDFNTEDTQDYLKRKLPEYMVPGIWVTLPEMPLTRNGKIDKKRLPSPEQPDTGIAYVAPRNKIESELVAIWEELLGIESVGIHDDFFALGGHSILAIKLVSKVNLILSKKLSVSILFEYPTIALLLENTSSIGSAENNIIITLQEKGHQTPIFFTPPVGGTVGCYRELVKLLGDQQPVHAFQCPGLDGKTPISGSLEEMATTFIEEMQKIDSSGPYRLGGYSFGGRVALEMALQLTSAGFKVEELLSIDAELPEVSNQISEELDQDNVFRDFLHEEIDEIRELFEIELALPDSILEGKSKEEQIKTLCKWIGDSGLAMTEDEIRGHLEVVFSNTTYPYIPVIEEKLNTKVILFRAAFIPVKLGIEPDVEIGIEDNDAVALDYGWSRYTNKEVKIYSIPTTHPQILDHPFVNQISEYLIENSTEKKIDDMIYS
ncbi:non-ribosomal peptide synthetase, partial [Aquimarina sp. RZ0]|uniref:non-ribosomal peptide synthetase n=1 Tax=Aquimarina sp. RZ0 TaxID=2607730 RepID=UPI0011F0C50B